jgi:hypothetical protein
MATRRLAALVAAAALALAGCGGDGDDPVDGDGYTYETPDGWADVSDDLRDESRLEFAGIRPDTVVADEAEDDFATNVNVVAEPGVPDALTSAEFARANIAGLRDPSAALRPDVAESIEALDVRDIRETGTVDLDGHEAVTWEYLTTQLGRDLRLRQVGAVRDGTGYTITMTAVPDRFEEGSDALDDVLGSWRWE